MNVSDAKSPSEDPTETPEQRQFRLHHRVINFILPGIVGLVCALLLVGVITAFAWGQTVSDGSDGTFISTAWYTALSAAAILFAVLVTVGLPVFWTKNRGYKKTLEVITFEGLFLLIALLISGYILYHNVSDGAPGIGCGFPSGAEIVNCPMIPAN